jgi:hypothetical protein
VLAVIEEMMQVVGGAILQIAHSEYAISKGSRIIVLGPDGSGIVEEGELEVLANNPKSRFRQLFPKS